MTRALLHLNDGKVECELELPATPAAPKLEWLDHKYEYVGFQDGCAHYKRVDTEG